MDGLQESLNSWYAQLLSVYHISLSTHHSLMYLPASLNISPFPEYSM